LTLTNLTRVVRRKRTNITLKRKISGVTGTNTETPLESPLTPL
jgi:hypothetical protein